MSKEFVNPNLHVILIHYPLALLTLGTFIELFAFLWRRSAFRAAGRWMILLGALALVPTATIGLYAMSDVNRTADTPGDATWQQVRAESPIKGHAWNMMQEHAWYTAAGSVVILLLVVSYLAASDVFRRRMHLVYLVLLLGGLAAIVLGAWHGGEMIYHHGVSVKSAGAGEEVKENFSEAADESSPASEEKTEAQHGIEYYAPPLQVHVILAGLAVSIGLAAIGLSFRAGSVALRPTPELSDINYALDPRLRVPDPHTTAAQLNYLDGPAMPVEVSRPPAARFFVLAALVGVTASLTGFWVLGGADLFKLNQHWQTIMDDMHEENYRRLAHVVAGGGIIVLMLLLALIARMAAGRRIVLGFFVLLLLGAVSAQIWLGSLLMFDSSAGPVVKFNSEPAAEAKEPASMPTTRSIKAPATTTTTPTTSTAAASSPG